MTILSQMFIGEPGHPRWITVFESPLGMLQNEEYLSHRIKGGEQASYDFILEIAESTLPFRNVDNLLLNLIEHTTWTSENVNLRAMCDQVTEACKKGFTPNTVPATMGSCYRRAADMVASDGTPLKLQEPDEAGRDQKYYPHTYEAILRPHMIPALGKTFAKVAEERETRARNWWRGYRVWDQARCDAAKSKS
jgi:hypothetical protein